MPNAAALAVELDAIADPTIAAGSAWFFKTGKGQYGEGDIFIGIRVPRLRQVALRYRELAFDEIEALLASAIHEHRFVALEILVMQYERGTPAQRKRVCRFYLAHTDRINNWDLVDTSAPYIVGEQARERGSQLLLERLARSERLWERRIAIVATFAFLRHGETEPAFAIAQSLLQDPHELIHKAVGWALREAGKVNQATLLHFLEEHYALLPRTTLRYAIERFPPTQRAALLRGQFNRKYSRAIR